eukprot:2471917-Pyramimonas_sp.AAC.1
MQLAPTHQAPPRTAATSTQTPLEGLGGRRIDPADGVLPRGHGCRGPPQRKDARAPSQRRMRPSTPPPRQPRQ